MKRVLVIGGGGSGAQIAGQLSRRLDPKFHELVLVTARPFFIFLPAAVRMAVTDDGHLEERVLIPYDRLFSGIGDLRVGKGVSIQEGSAKERGSVLLEDGQTVAYDVLVLATGTKLDGPLAYPGTKEETLDFIRSWRRKFREADRIVMAGGGPVNVEFSGEIKECWPTKKVTIVQSGNLPLNKVYPDKFRRRVESECRARGVDFVFEDYLDQEVPEGGMVTTRKGKKLPADLVISARGGTPATAFIKTLGPDVLSPGGLVRANPTLELVDHPGIFCAGDVVDNNERNKLGKYEQHAMVITANVLDRLNGRGLSATYKRELETISLSLGKTGGVSYIDICGGIVLGNWYTWYTQARTLLLPKGRRALGY